MGNKDKAVDHPSGVDDGTVLETPIHGEPNTEVVVHREVVVHEDDGTWHKEVVE